MHYSKIYDSIIERAKNRILTEYSEKHHILPKCLGGTDDSYNLVRLTFREHFICHQLLCKMHPGNKKLIYAFSSMVRVSPYNHRRNDALTSRHFDLVKKTISPYIGKWNVGKTPWNKGITGDDYKARYNGNGLTPPNHVGSKWINNGVETKKISLGEALPEGYVYGRLSMCGNNNPMRNKETAKLNTDIRKKTYDSKKHKEAT